MMWPTTLAEDTNWFTFATFDPETPPTKIEVRTWSNVFGTGGSVSVDMWHGDKRSHTHLTSIEIDREGSVRDEREHLQALVDDWNEDAAENWRTLITECRTRALEHERKEIVRVTENLAKHEKGDWS